MKLLKFILIVISIFIFTTCDDPTPEIKWDTEWEAEIYPAEHKITVDSTSGAKLIFVTTNKGSDINLYFDWNCWFEDLSMMAFISQRTGRGELFGYVPKTGELIRLNPREDVVVITQAVVDYKSHDMYVRRSDAIYQWHIQINFSADSTKVEKVHLKERKIATVPEGSFFYSALSQSADRRYLSATIRSKDPDEQSIIAVNIQTGKINTLLTWDNTHSFSHVQFSKYNPNLLRFSHHPHRMWVIDTRIPGKAKKIHLQEKGELVTHEDWWVNDQLTFCGAYRTEESHLKVIDIYTQEARVIGPGAWWEGGAPFELSKYNWWHASGARNGRWVAADNWHGHIAVTDARTSHLRILTRDHRTYGIGVHPHVGWAPDSKSVEFTTHKLGNPDVCIAYLPEAWDEPFMENDSTIFVEDTK